MKEIEAKCVLALTYPKQKLRKMYKSGIRFVCLPKLNGQWKFSIIELLDVL